MEDYQAVSQLLLYPDDHAGGLMTPEVVAFDQGITGAHATERLRESELPRQNFRQLFAIDREGRLVGRLNMPDLVLSPSSFTIQAIMNPDVFSVGPGTDQEEVARLMARYQLRSLPVVDRDRVLVGAVAIEDIIQVAEDEATEDMLKMVGTAGDERLTGPITKSIRNRSPWLLANLATVLMAGDNCRVHTSCSRPGRNRRDADRHAHGAINRYRRCVHEPEQVPHIARGHTSSGSGHRPRIDSRRHHLGVAVQSGAGAYRQWSASGQSCHSRGCRRSSTSGDASLEG